MSLLRSAQASRRAETSGLRRLTRCFSLRRNVARLLDTSVSDTELGCLHGVRVLSLAWVVLVNSAMYQSLFTRNAVRLFGDWRSHSLRYAFIGNGNLALDSLFALSGLLAGYAHSRQLDRQAGGSMSMRMRWGPLVLRRYWRVAPSLTLAAAGYVALFPYLTRGGPLSTARAPDHEACLRWGWLNALLVQNLFAPAAAGGGATCMSWTWFLAVDFQLFLLAPPLLWLLHRRPRLAYWAVALLVLASWAASGALTLTHDLPVSQFVLPNLAGGANNSSGGHSGGGGGGDSGGGDGDTGADVEAFVRLYLYKPWAHTGAFFPPLLLGHRLHACDRRATGFRARTVVAGWVAAAALSAAVLLGPRKELVGERGLGRGGVAVYNAVQRTLWGLAVGWVALACSTGRGGVLNSLLAWPGWKPLSRLTFAAYLLHPVVAMAFSACLGQLLYATAATAAYQFLGVLALSLLLAAALTLLCEMPLTALPDCFGSCCRP